MKGGYMTKTPTDISSTIGQKTLWSDITRLEIDVEQISNVERALSYVGAYAPPPEGFCPDPMRGCGANELMRPELLR